MPFKSKRQQRFLFAAQERGDVPKGTAERWAKHTPNIKRLPEKVRKKESQFEEMAREVGRLAKVAYVKTGDWTNLMLRMLPYVGPAVLGAYFAGPGYRVEGGLAGLGAGALGKSVGRAVAAQNIPEAAKLMEAGSKAPQALAGLPSEAAKTLQNYELAGRLIGGAGGGFGVGRILGAQNPYGLQPVFPGLGKENPLGLRE